MKALILAAGRGRRLRPLTASKPKCLLPIGDTTILGHQLYCLRRAGVRTVVVVCGHGADSVRQELARQARGLAGRALYNPLYAVADNMVSLWTARDEMDESLLLLNGDTVTHPRAFALLTDSPFACCLLAARKEFYSAEDMKLRLDGTRVVAIGKALPVEQADAASVGALRFDVAQLEPLRQELDWCRRQPELLGCHFPAVIQRLADRGQRLDAVDVGELAWADVDTPADLEFVRANLQLFQDHQECAELARERG